MAKMRCVRFGWVVGCAWAGCAPVLAETPAQAAVQVELFSPQGTAKQVRQVVARFSAPLVALGDPRLPAPFVVDCAAPGRGRWADARNWIYDFEEMLPAGLRCRFTSRETLAPKGGTLAGGLRFEFDTGGPAVILSFPHEGREGIDEEQIFLLRLDAAATEASVRRHAYCAVEGIGERIPVQVLTGEKRAVVLDQRNALGYAYRQLLWPRGGVHKPGRDELEAAEAQVVALRCQRRLPAATPVRLVWEAGIAAVSGIVTRQAQALSFRVRPAFTARIECSRTEPRAGCLPMKPITLLFSAPVPRERALQARLRITDARGRRAELRAAIPPGENSPAPPGIAPAQATIEALTFAPPFPAAGIVSVELPTGLTDDAGRALENAARFPLAVAIDEFPPLAKFATDFGILEARQGGVLPVTLRNLEVPGAPGAAPALRAQRLRVASEPAAVAGWLRRVEAAMARRATPEYDEQTQTYHWREDTGDCSVFGEEDTPKSFTLDTHAGTRETEVLGIPLRSSGLHVVEIASDALGAALLGRPATRYVATAALVTDLAVHFKWGREGSRVWVTRLDDAWPVAGAEITITDYCSGAVRWQGRTGPDGLAAIGAELGEPHRGSDCRWPPAPLMVSARTAEDFSFTLSSWNEGIAAHDFGLRAGSGWSAQLAHTVLDRPLFRAGETVSMKHFLRRHHSAGLAAPEEAARTHTVLIAHAGSDQRYKLEASFDPNGVAEQQWPIPAEAALGDYFISIEARRDQWQHAGRFKVEAVRLPTMRASLVGPAQTQVQPAEVQLDLHVAYLSGGGAAGLPVRLRTLIEPRWVRYAGYEAYGFGGQPVEEGVTRAAAGGWDFTAQPTEGAAARPAQLLPVTLDAQGAARATVGQLPALDHPAQLVAELEYPDANGELLTTTARVPLAPAALAIGIRTDSWVASAEQLRLRVVALDLAGRPRAGEKVSVSLFSATAYSYRKRLIGGFYAYETVREVKRLPERCGGETNAQGLLLCELAPGVSGEVIVRAETRDEAGRTAGATRSVWVAGAGEWWFGGTHGDRMDVLPEKKEYAAGTLARFQVRMPFRAATALVTVEREGVLESFVTRLNGRAPVIEVPIAAHYAPNVYVSVLALRGRVGQRLRRGAADREVTALVDLNKPAYRLGIAEIKVGWEPHRLEVEVSPERAEYRVRETARVRLQVRRADGAALPAGAEVALAAVDEALLELAPNPSWELLAAMMGRRGLEVSTATAQMQVVGKRHYGRKAVAHGGGGGRERAREAFDTLLAWHPRVPLDAQGRAEVAIPLNDSLSSFRIVAVAHAGAQLFGTGSATVASSQPLILVSGLPPVVRGGDRYAATFTVRNTGTRPLEVELSAVARPGVARIGQSSAGLGEPRGGPDTQSTSGSPAEPTGERRAQPAGGPPDAQAAGSLATQTVQIAPGEARVVSWAFEVPTDIARLDWEVGARERGGPARDALKIMQPVLAAFPVRTYQATLTQLTAPLALPAARPAAALPGQGGIEVAVRARLGEGLDGVREYMARYPFVCLEQNLSRAVALRDEAAWHYWMRRLPAYMDRQGLLKYFPAETLPGEDVLTAYVLALAHEAGWEIPAAERERLLQALVGFTEGHIVRGSALATADLTVRKLAAIEALARHGAARPHLIDSLTVEPALWPTSAVIDWLNILRRMPQLPRAGEQAATAEAVLRTRLNFQGTTLGFSTEGTDALWWLMVSGDSNAVRMLLAVLDRPGWREDLPRLVRGALGRQQRGHWSTTVANAWGVVAMEKFSAAFEATPVTGTTAIRYDTHSRSVKWPQAASASSAMLTPTPTSAALSSSTSTQTSPSPTAPPPLSATISRSSSSSTPSPASPLQITLDWQDQPAELQVHHRGGGHPWAVVRTTAALPLEQPLFTGFKVERTLVPIEQRTAGRWSRGDVVRVRLTVEAQSDMTWVVVEDPVPAGASLLGGTLGGRSHLLIRGERDSGGVWPAYEERRFEAFRAYYRYVPRGRWTLEYTLRLNNPGEFLLPATRVEAMYAPEMLGELPNAALIVHE